MAGAFGAPFLHIFLTRVAPHLHLGSLSPFKFLLMRLFVHQAIVMPLNMLQFFIILGLLHNNFSLEKTIEVQIPKYKRAVVAGWKFWPLLLILMYTRVSIMYQNLFMDICAYFYAIIVSFIQSSSSSSKESIS